MLVVPAGDGRFIVVGATLSNSQEALYRLLELFAVALPVALIASSLIGWWLAGLALRPVARMIDEAERISAVDPGRRLPVPDTDPALERLALALNATLDRLQEAYERERSFADNASHELRTPLTVLKAEVDSALAEPRSEADLREALASASAEVDHLVRIAEGLLVLARANGGTIPTLRTEARVDQLVEECLRPARRRAAERGVTLRSSAPDASRWSTRRGFARRWTTSWTTRFGMSIPAGRCSSRPRSTTAQCVSRSTTPGRDSGRRRSPTPSSRSTGRRTTMTARAWGWRSRRPSPRPTAAAPPQATARREAPG